MTDTQDLLAGKTTFTEWMRDAVADVRKRQENARRVAEQRVDDLLAETDIIRALALDVLTAGASLEFEEDWGDSDATTEAVNAVHDAFQSFDAVHPLSWADKVGLVGFRIEDYPEPIADDEEEEL